MRRLTFKGFLESYVMELSYMGTCSISKLVNELDDNPRLREPLLLYAYLSKMPRGIEKKMLSSTRRINVYAESLEIMNKSLFCF